MRYDDRNTPVRYTVLRVTELMIVRVQHRIHVKLYSI